MRIIYNKRMQYWINMMKTSMLIHVDCQQQVIDRRWVLTGYRTINSIDSRRDEGFMVDSRSKSIV